MNWSLNYLCDLKEVLTLNMGLLAKRRLKNQQELSGIIFAE